MYLTTRLRFTEPQNATQAAQERLLDKPADDKGDGLERNTSELDAIGEARGEPETKVGSPCVSGRCRVDRSHAKIFDPVTHHHHERHLT